jgi:N-methylhydantoinase B/oxoprolinase/acetone carboxylase alpha subunit
MKFSAEAIIAQYPMASMKPGDVYLVNDPYQGGTHINDMTFLMPIFYEDEILGFAVSRGHWMDLGGGAAGGQAFHGTHIAGEGLRLPPLKLYEGGKVREDLLAIIVSNTRTPHFVKGDTQAHVGALKAAQQEMERAADKYGVATLKAAMKQLQEYTERIVRKSIAEMPDGEYEAEEYADTDGHSDKPIPIKVKLVIKGSDITVDFSGTGPTVKGAINSPYANTASATLYSLQFFLAPHAPQNQGMFNPITIKLPENCWLNAKWPAPTIGCTTLTSSKITSAIWQALAKACPEKITGSTNAECNWFVSSVVAPDGTTDVFSDLPAGGWGGTPYSDGMSVTEDPLGNCMNMPAETAELLFPVAYEAFELRPDSGGPGKHRGGLGAVFKVRYLCDGELSMESARTLEGTPGVNGGRRSDVQRQIKIHPDGRKEVIGGRDEQGNWKSPLLSNVPFRFGETFMFESTGGGGWGNPLERNPQAVLDDVLDGYITAEAAREVYGVVIDGETIDAGATARRRAELRTAA